MISELWHREQPSRKLINTGCCRRLPPPPHPCSCLSKGFPPSFPSAVAVSPPAPCPGAQGEQGCPSHCCRAAQIHPCGISIPTSPLWKAAVPSCNGIPCPGINPVSNSISFASLLFPHQQSCPSVPFLSFLLTFPGNKLQGAIMPCAKENIKAGTISVEDVARQAATQKRG